MVDAQESIVTALGAAGCRVTAPRRALAGLISHQNGPFTSAELASAARRHHLRVGRATLFRSLELLAGLGLLERIDLPDNEHAYVRCAPQHHHHVVCSRCGRAVEIQDSGLADAVADIGRRTGFRIDTHRIEMFGLCASCRRTAPGQ